MKVLFGLSVLLIVASIGALLLVDFAGDAQQAIEFVAVEPDPLRVGDAAVLFEVHDWMNEPLSGMRVECWLESAGGSPQATSRATEESSVDGVPRYRWRFWVERNGRVDVGVSAYWPDGVCVSRRVVELQAR
ncbi:MAG: hypothetical protein L6Q99_21750 [Planctomycetes bacterium]|nr:hypothetical protein [Planctomycetota bacterium]